MVFLLKRLYCLLQRDSLLYIVPSQGGKPRRMNCNMEGTMNSWHSWSPNGRWVVLLFQSEWSIHSIMVDAY